MAWFCLNKSLLFLLAANVTLPEVMSHLQATRNATDFRASGRLVRIDGQQRKNYQISMRGQAAGGVLKIFCEVTEPAASRVRLLLESFPDGKNVIYTGHAGDAKATELPFERWGERLLDTDFSFEDLMENQFLWRNQSLGEQAVFGMRPSVVLKSVANPRDRTNYSAVTSWLDRDIFYPLKEEKTVKGSGIVKEFLFFGLRQSKGMWSASQIECKTRGRSGSTLLIITRGSEKARMDEKAFDPALLVKP
jgi:hypothetical protein